MYIILKISSLCTIFHKDLFSDIIKYKYFNFYYTFSLHFSFTSFFKCCLQKCSDVITFALSSSSKYHQYFVLKRYISRRRFLQSSLRRSNIYDMRFLFRILARRRAMPTKSLHMHSKPLSVFVFCTRFCPREAIFFLFAFFSTHTAKE